MNVDKQYNELFSRVIQSNRRKGELSFMDVRPDAIYQSIMIDAIQRKQSENHEVSLIYPHNINVIQMNKALLGLSLLIFFLSSFQGRDFDSIDDMAEHLGITKDELILRFRNGFINTKEEHYNFVYSELSQLIHKYSEKAHSKLVPPKIIEGLKFKNKLEKLDIIFKRINELSFTYVGNAPAGANAVGFYTRHGDCSTLASMFRIAAIAAGINDVSIKSNRYDRLIDRAKIHGEEKQGNTVGKLFWSFGNHYWCECEGCNYDLLFMKKEKIKDYKKRNNTECRYNGKSFVCDVYDNGYIGYYNQDKGEYFVTTPDRFGLRKYIKRICEKNTEIF